MKLKSNMQIIMINNVRVPSLSNNIVVLQENSLRLDILRVRLLHSEHLDHSVNSII